MKKIKPGLHFDISFEDYVEIPAINNSTLKILTDQSPAHALHYINHGRPETKALAFGSLADMYILEPLLFFKNYVVGPDARRNSNIWKQFVAENPDKEVIKPDDMAAAIAIYNKISQSHAMRLLSGGVSQVVAIWEDEETGLLCKSRMDYLNTDINLITDLKTTQSSKPESFSRDIDKYKYHMQSAFYTDGMIKATGETDWAFAFFAVEKVEPYVASAFQLGDLSIEIGREMYRKAITKYAECLKTNEWPEYCSQVEMIDVPKWVLERSGYGQHNAR